MSSVLNSIRNCSVFLSAVALLLTATPGQQQSADPPPLKEVRIVATTEALAGMVRNIGGQTVDVDVLVKPGSNPHAVLPKASHLLVLKKAHGLISMGLDYEHAFLPALLEKSRNRQLKGDGQGHEVVGKRIQALQIPATLDRGQGADLHPRGNPHFDLDPEGGRNMAAATRDLMQRVDPGRRELYQKRWQEWDQRAQARIVEWKKYMQPLRGRKVVAYHNSWPYFEAAFGLQFIGFVEPKPGLRPSPKHLALLGQQMTEQQVRVVMMEPWYPQSEINGLLKRTSCTAVLLPTISTAADGYLKWMEALVEQFGVAHGLPKLDDWRQLQKASNE